MLKLERKVAKIIKIIKIILLLKEKDYNFDLIFKKIENKYVSNSTIILCNNIM